VKGENLRHIISTYVNITMYPPVPLLYTNKIIKNKKMKKANGNSKLIET
jgi:hypothetical protein